MKISELIDQVAAQIVDVNHVRWTRPELLDFLNMGLSSLIIKRPDIARTTATQIADTAKINIPDDAYSIITLNHVNNRAVQFVDINKLNQLNPEWRNDIGAPLLWTRNELDNESFYLYPAPDQGYEMEVVYAKAIKVESETEDFPIKQIYSSILFDYMIYRAFAKDSEQPGEAEKARYHLMVFKDALGDKDAADSLREQILQSKEKQR